MKQRKLLDKAIVAAMLLAYVPGALEDALPAPEPAALIAPASANEAPADDESPADKL